MSRAAIAAAVALEDVVGGERLVAFALASFANREQLAWPGVSTAAARAALSRSRYLQASNQLLRDGLIEAHDAGGGRGRSTTFLLRFVDGPRFDRPVNAELFETVLCYSRSSGPARLLLASIAALADEHRQLDGVTADELCAAAGLARSTYRRARNALIASGELQLVSGLGGRGRSNCWQVADVRSVGQPATSSPRCRAPAGPVRPLMTPTVPRPAVVNPGTGEEPMPEPKSLQLPIDGMPPSVKGAQDRTVSAVKGAQDRTVSAVKGAQDRTVSLETQPETEPQRGPKREPPNARAWKEPGNLRTSEHPPNPPEGGPCAGELFVEQAYVTERGRERKRLVRIDPDAIRARLSVPNAAKLEAWLQARSLLLERAGESVFEVWLASIELVAVDRDGLLVLAGPEATSSWAPKRFGRLISDCCEETGCRVRFASPQERMAIQDTPPASRGPLRLSPEDRLAGRDPPQDPPGRRTAT